MLQDPEHPRPARSVPVGRREPALVGMAATLTRRLGVYRRHLFISIFGDVAMSEFELWVKKRRAQRLHEQFVLTLAMMGPLMAILLTTLSSMVAARFGIAPSLFWLLPSAVVSFYTIRKLVYEEHCAYCKPLRGAFRRTT